MKFGKYQSHLFRAVSLMSVILSLTACGQKQSDEQPQPNPLSSKRITYISDVSHYGSSTRMPLGTLHILDSEKKSVSGFIPLSNVFLRYFATHTSIVCSTVDFAAKTAVLRILDPNGSPVERYSPISDFHLDWLEASGTRIAYVNRAYELHILDSNGGHVAGPIANVRESTVRLNSTRITYMDRVGNLYILDSNGGHVAGPIANVHSIELSSARVAYITGPTRVLHVLDLNGSPIPSFTPIPYIHSVQLSGTRIAYVNRLDELLIHDRDGTLIGGRILNVHDLKMSSTQITYHDGAGTAYILDSNGSPISGLGTFPGSLFPNNSGLIHSNGDAFHFLDLNGSPSLGFGPMNEIDPAGFHVLP